MLDCISIKIGKMVQYFSESFFFLFQIIIYTILHTHYISTIMDIYKSKYNYKQIETVLESLINTVPAGSKILFETLPTSANFEIITLLETAADYDYLEIYAITDDGHSLYQKIDSPDGKFVTFSASLVGGSNYFTKSKVIQITGATIKTAESKNWSTGETVKMAGCWGTNNPTQFIRDEIYIGIYKVVGIKSLSV